MAGLKRFIRPGLVVSIIAHVGTLLLVLVFYAVRPSESVPPAPMLVEIVPPDAEVVDKAQPREPPRREGTASALRASGSRLPSPSPSPSISDATPPSAPPATAQPQRQRPARAAPDSAKSDAPSPEAQSAEAGMAEPEAARAMEPHTAKTELLPPPPAPQQPQPEQTPDRSEAAETLARLALLGGPLGAGFEAPPVDANQAGYDFTAAFRERVSSCSMLPPGIDSTDDVAVRLRVFFNRDGTLAARPQALEPIVSAKQRALMESSIRALQLCQPYTTLLAAKYKRWRILDLTFYPMNFLGR